MFNRFFLSSTLLVSGLLVLPATVMASTVDYQKAIPQGFESILENPSQTTVAGVLNSQFDGQYVSLQGYLTKYLGHELYQFEDNTGSITVELDDDKDWSYLAKDSLIEIMGVVERSFMSIKIDVKQASPIKQQSNPAN